MHSSLNVGKKHDVIAESSQKISIMILAAVNIYIYIGKQEFVATESSRL
jgi:hypothetical protein